MRVIGRLRREERGAVLVMVALALVVLLGMLALTVDLGRMVAIKRQMVRAADAAALAAAQECAFGNGSAAAQAAALGLARQNRPEVSITGFTADPACDGATSTDPNLVTVRLSTTVDMFVAPIFGAGFDERAVVAEATATWSSAGPIPISVDVVPLEACMTRDPPPTEDKPCVIEYPKENLENPRWGILDLSVWGDGSVSSCPVPNSEIVGIIEQNGWGSDLKPPPQWDCLDNGAQFASWMALEGRTVWFPVIDVPKSKGRIIPGNDPRVCYGSEIPKLQAEGKDCQITTAWVLRFVQMQVLDVYKIGDTHVLETVIVKSGPSSRPGLEIRLVD